ncbi:V/A-type H+-transporting ATPase subunit A [Methanomicrobium sp. W14]|uniref:V-type ATP synthase subunit A n=1 Tax=Methanomicrobium sp. W14 TaxID=2817839 RepID=UPI001AE284B5|nr:V-type ATP synthase subunit A [Methanomicrobium sp. W14]MBP2133324.1 V/A-type H+-transporting ATPase subunit A [Methanomicrobium sp. W14]
MKDNPAGTIVKIAGPVITAENMRGTQMYELVRAGDEKLVGEVISLERDTATVQVYEDTRGLFPGQPVEGTKMPLSAELGPGLLGMIYDGIQRPLEKMSESVGDFIIRGTDIPSLDRERLWEYSPRITVNSPVSEGDILGTVPEESITHKILVPPGISGELVWTAPKGEYTIEDIIAKIRTEKGREFPVKILRHWPVRKERPVRKKLDPKEPLITGQRVIDTLFPIAKGGTSAVPGPFGAGKTVVQHQLAKWSDADIIVYVGCGERGNEMADVLREFPVLEDPKTHKPLMRRTVLIANTSNMPVAAREASVYTGITIAEYYRDMGYDVALMADSTSRWAEAMREISGRLEEMPGEQGYPAYLASRLAGFYERAGRAKVLGSEERNGSISVIGAVSPPGGDFSEPVTQNTLRITGAFWALDADLAHERHFPAINWLLSYSLYTELTASWWEEKTKENWKEMRQTMMSILQKESELEEIVQLVGPDVLPEEDKLVLLSADIIKESFLVQYATDPQDRYCSPFKQEMMMKLITDFFRTAGEAVKKGALTSEISALPAMQGFTHLGARPEDEIAEFCTGVIKSLKSGIDSVLAGGGDD